MGSSNQRVALVRARPFFVAVALAGILDYPTVAMLAGPCQFVPSSTRCAAGWHASAGSQLRGWGHAGGSTSRQHTPLQDGALHDGRRLGRVQHRGARSAGLMRLRGGGLFKKMKRGQPLSVAEKVCRPEGNPGANVKSISHVCHLILVAFVWELTRETIDLPLGCLQGGAPAMIPLKGVPRSFAEPPSGRRKELYALRDRIGTAIGATDEPRPPPFWSRGGLIR